MKLKATKPPPAKRPVRPSKTFSHYRIRRARAREAREGAELIYLPMGTIADYLFGMNDPGRAKRVLAKLFSKKRTRFSHEFCDFLETRSGIAGALVSYPARIMSDMNWQLARQLSQILGLKGMWQFLRRSLPLAGYKEAEPDEFYIYTLAVKPEFQHEGFGSRLLDHALEKTKQAGLFKCSLGVAINNRGAIRFYKKYGFKIVETIRMPPLQEALQYPGYYRMVKRT